eukprot:7305461-Karenia_brevis.AAC.1
MTFHLKVVQQDSYQQWASMLGSASESMKSMVMAVFDACIFGSITDLKIAHVIDANGIASR